MNLLIPWKEATFVAFDTETSGKYPMESEICEIAAVKWKSGSIIAEYQQLVKPTKTMSEEVIKIHNITNEMVENQPPITQVLPDFYSFIADSFLVAHHAPFDLGFLAIEFEKMGLPFLESPVFCSSLLSRALLPGSINHKLQTLVNYLQISQGSAHRALDDSRACMQVTLKCFEKAGNDKTIEDLLRIQKKKIFWESYSIKELEKTPHLAKLVLAIREGANSEIVYMGGSRPGQPRVVRPISVVRGPTGDFLVAISEGEVMTKRYFLDKIKKVY